MGSGNLKEIGIKLDAGIIDINHVLKELNTRKATNHKLKQLDKRHQRYWINNRETITKKGEARTFLEWYDLPFKPDWKISSWGTTGSFAEEAKRISKEDYNVSSPHRFLGARINDYEEDDWVLTYREEHPLEIEWLYVNYVVKIHRNEKAYDRDYPRQIVQVWPLNKYPRPPFKANKKFSKAFSEAISQFSYSEKEEMDGGLPPKKLLRLIRKRYD